MIANLDFIRLQTIPAFLKQPLRVDLKTIYQEKIPFTKCLCKKLCYTGLERSEWPFKIFNQSECLKIAKHKFTLKFI